MSERAPELRLTEEVAKQYLSDAAHPLSALPPFEEVQINIAHDAWAAHALKRERDTAEAALKQAIGEGMSITETLGRTEIELAAERELRLAAEADRDRLREAAKALITSLNEFAPLLAALQSAAPVSD